MTKDNKLKEQGDRLNYLAMSKKDMKAKGYQECDFIIVTGDAYVDHPSFGAAVIGRVLERRGYKVGIIAQPNWKNDGDFRCLGRPKLGFLITSGNIDSMVNHYTVNLKKRHKDLYTPGGKAGKRPDRALTVYSNRIREIFGDIPIIIGGVEASLRRFAHYDYWKNKVMPPILIDSQADLLVYGMGEKAMIEVAEALESGIPIKYISYIKGTSVMMKEADFDQAEVLPSFTEMATDRLAYARGTKIINQSNNAFDERIRIQPYKDHYLVQNQPQPPLSQLEFDDLYELPFTYHWHPTYDEQGGVPALEEVKFSITANRGCFGNCNFCAITIHQGKYIQMRSSESIVREAKRMIEDPDFKGYIHDIGGPTANFSHPPCQKQERKGYCSHQECLSPRPCKQLDGSHEPYLKALRQVRKLSGVKKVFIRSGIRYDYLQLDRNKAFFKELVEHHVSGQLRVAPEHISENALKAMGKPSFDYYKKFVEDFNKLNDQLGKKQYVLPYFITGHPGTSLSDAIQLAEYIRDMGFMPEQIQDFYPTPGSLATAMYYTGLDPLTMKSIHVPDKKEKQMQRALAHFQKRENHQLVKEALIQADREDLMGNGKNKLIPDWEKIKPIGHSKKKNKRQGRSLKKKGIKK